MILKSGSIITTDPVEKCEFNSHANIEYIQFNLEKDDHFPPELDLLLEKMQKEAKYLIDESLDEPIFTGKEYKIDPADQKSRTLI